MNAALTATLFGLMAAVAWGVSDFLVGKSSKAVGAMKGALLVNSYGALIYSVAYVLFLHDRTTFTAEGVWYAVGGGVLLGLAQAMFFRAMSLGPVGLVSSISSVYPLVTLLLGVVLFATRLSALRVFGIVLVVAGVMIASGITDLKASSRRLGRGPLLALVPIVGWGAGFALISQSIARMDWEATFLIEVLVTPLVLVVLTPFIRGSEEIRITTFRASWLRPVVWSAAAGQMIGLLSVNLGISKAPASAAIVVAVSSCYPVLTIPSRPSFAGTYPPCTAHRGYHRCRRCGDPVGRLSIGTIDCEIIRRA